MLSNTVIDLLLLTGLALCEQPASQSMSQAIATHAGMQELVAVQMLGQDNG